MKKTYFLGIIILLFFILLILPKNTNAYGECTQYGFMSYYDFLTNSCKCMSGYVWGTNFMGEPYCISGTTYCYNEYGYGSSFNYLTNSCECSHGYVWGTLLGNPYCISGNTYCHDEYGYNSSYDTLTNSCECNSGYEMTQTITGLECVSCFMKYGIHSNYNYLTKHCECDDDYTLNESGQCVETQHNVYFLLKEVNTNEREAVINSDYDYQNYLITYGFGCLSSTIDRYLNDKIVVNLGTDYEVDVFDTVVLYNNSQTCSILSVEKVSSLYSLDSEDNMSFYLINPLIENQNNVFDSVAEREKENFTSKDLNLTNQLKGKILLQVESVGEAWYVHPNFLKKYYMEDGDAAYQVLREFGLGITNNDLAKIPVGVESRFNDIDTDNDGLSDKLEEGLQTNTQNADTDNDGISDGDEILVNNTNPLGNGKLLYSNTLINNLKGKILLQVESRGEAWYLNPDDGKRYYMKNGDAAYQIMRYLSLGITNNNLRKIEVGEL